RRNMAAIPGNCLLLEGTTARPIQGERSCPMSVTMSKPESAGAGGSTAIRPFRMAIPQDAIDDVYRRLAATRWPSKELVADRSQGVQLATLQALARYWARDYDFRKLDARLNALPQL